MFNKISRDNRIFFCLLAVALVLISCSAGCGHLYSKSAADDWSLHSMPTQTNTIPILMKMDAGADKYKVWTSGNFTAHSGVGTIEPFGKASYYCGAGYAEEAALTMPGYFTDEWNKDYNTDKFCLYRLEDGDIYTNDGITGNLLPDGYNGIKGNKSDLLVEMVLGGTGAYKGARGIWIGTATGYGEAVSVKEKWTLPVELYKNMTGFVILQEE
jgi:hypothetical protein